MPTVTGGTAGQQATVNRAIDRARARTAGITDADLRDCIGRKLQAGSNFRIQLEANEEGDNRGGWAEWTTFCGIKISAEDVIHLCMTNLEGRTDDFIGQVILHEVAHSCCWHHGDGEGVPGNDGRL